MFRRKAKAAEPAQPASSKQESSAAKSVVAQAKAADSGLGDAAGSELEHASGVVISMSQDRSFQQAAQAAGAATIEGGFDISHVAGDLLRKTSEGKGNPAGEELRELANVTFKGHMSLKALLVIIAVLIFAVVASLSLGRYSMNPLDAVNTLLLTIRGGITGDYGDLDINMYRSLFFIRLPRIFIVMLVGGALAMAGASYQGMFKNPLTSPDLLGASAGASVGACLGLLMNTDGATVQAMAFLGGLVAVGCTVWLTRFVQYDAMLGLVLAGILTSTLFQSIMSIIKLLADGDNKLPEITYWLMGSFAKADQVEILPFLVPMGIGFVLLLVNARRLNVLSFGDEEARALGVNTKSTRLWVILGATLITSVSVAVAGVVGWIGLVVPHLARAVVGPNYKALLPTSLLVGAVFLLLVDDLSRLVLAVEIPIGILTSILGIPFFAFIFKKNMKGW